MKVLINGCSYTHQRVCKKEQQTWSDALQHYKPDWQIDNLAVGAAGNRFIFETSIEYLERNKPDLVCIMWSGTGRKDVNITDEQYSRMRNEQKNKEIRYAGYAKRFDRNWLCGGGVWCDTNISLEEAFKTNTIAIEVFREHMSGYMLRDEPFERSLKSINYMIDLQQILEEKNIPYVFMSYQNYWNKQSALMLKEKLYLDVNDQFSYNSGGSAYICDFPKLFSYAKKHLNFDKWCWAGREFRCVFEFAMEEFERRSGTYDDGDHPNYTAHSLFVEKYLLPKLQSVYNIT